MLRGDPQQRLPSGYVYGNFAFREHDTGFMESLLSKAFDVSKDAANDSSEGRFKQEWVGAEPEIFGPTEDGRSLKVSKLNKLRSLHMYDAMMCSVPASSASSFAGGLHK